MMCSKNLGLALCILTLGACQKKTDVTTGRLKNERQDYYDRISDAPIDVYCHVNGMLDPAVRRDLCSALSRKYSNNMTLNLSVTIAEGKLDTLMMLSLYFDEEGRPHNDTLTSDVMTKALAPFDIEQIPTLRNLENEDFVMRLQLERFCPGYFYENEPEIEKRSKKMNR